MAPCSVETMATRQILPLSSVMKTEAVDFSETLVAYISNKPHSVT
jgi:hypothetical protein